MTMNFSNNTLLIEIGTEELPPKDLLKLSLSLQTNFADELAAHDLTYQTINSFATPRRLAIQVHGVAIQQQSKTVGRKGPALQAAFGADGKPTSAALGFAAACKVAIEQLQRQETPKGSWLYFEEIVPGKAIAALIPTMLENALAKLPVSKRMRWGELQQTFVRPVHWLVVLLNDQSIDMELFGVKANRFTCGHRFHHPNKIALAHANTYEHELATTGMVIADFNKRLALIKEQATTLARNAGGTLVAENEELFELITGLVEYPVPLLASFNREFLALPKETIIAAIQDHQKSLPIIALDGKLMAKFILISNIQSKDPAAVIHGNELVMHARLADAAFLFKEDQKHPFTTNIEQLKTVTFQAKLGSMYEKTLRIEKLATAIGKQIGADPATTKRAAALCKADLVSQMVYEFPELQGIMGCYYAQHGGEPTPIATAIKEHYLPRTSQDELPSTLPGICLALADRLDTLVGMFAIDKIPSGEKDPFALKRQALAILRICIEKELPVDLQHLCQIAHGNYKQQVQNVAVLEKLTEFFFERLRYWYLSSGVPAKTFEAVLAKRPFCPFDFQRRVSAVQAFQLLPAAESLAAANKRVKNILEQSSKTLSTSQSASINPIDTIYIIDTKLFSEQAEQTLYKAMQEQEAVVLPLLKSAQYQAVLTALANLREPLDMFFDKVMVMVDDERIKNNRLALLQKLRSLFLEVADISLL